MSYTKYIVFVDETLKRHFFFLHNSAEHSFKITKNVVATTRNETKTADRSRHAGCHPPDKFRDELSSFTRVTATVSCPQGYVCISEQRWNSMGNVLSAVMPSSIYTLSSFDFWNFAAVSLLITSLRYWEKLCNLRVWNKKREHIFTIVCCHLIVKYIKSTTRAAYILQRRGHVEYNTPLWI